MSDYCACPKPTSLTDIPKVECNVNLKQIQKLAFQRTGYQFGSNASPATDIKTLSDWQTAIAATDDSKIVITPMIASNPVIEAGDAITNGGGDNSTLNGVEEIEGTNPSKFSAELKSISPEIEKALKKLMCEPNLRVYFFLQGGRIAALKIDDQNQKGFATQSMFVSDRNNAGFGTKDTVKLSFSLPAGWSDDLVIIEPNFNPLVEL